MVPESPNRPVPPAWKPFSSIPPFPVPFALWMKTNEKQSLAGLRGWEDGTASGPSLQHPTRRLEWGTTPGLALPLPDPLKTSLTPQ